MPCGNQLLTFARRFSIQSSKRPWSTIPSPPWRRRTSSRALPCLIFVSVRRSTMSHTKAGSAFTELILETFRFNGRLLAAGDRLTRAFKLSFARWQVLGAIEQKPLPVAQIARDMGLARQSVQRLADNLEKAGIVEYAPNPDHGRAKLVRLNKKGRRVLEALTRSQIRWANEIASGARSGEIESALGLVRKLRLRLEADE